MQIGLVVAAACRKRDLHVNTYDGNVRCAAWHLRQLYQQEGSWLMAITRYNGRGAMARAYADRVLHRIGVYALEIAE